MKITWTLVALAAGTTLLPAQGTPPRPPRPAPATRPAEPRVTPRPAEAPTPVVPWLMEPLEPLMAPLPFELLTPLPSLGEEPLMSLAMPVVPVISAETPLPPLPSLAGEPMLAPMPALPLVPEDPLTPMPAASIPMLAPSVWDILPQQGTPPRPARTQADRDEARARAEEARSQAAMARELQLQFSREQNELQRDLARQQGELQREQMREQSERVREMAALAREQAMDRDRIMTGTFSIRSTSGAYAPPPWDGQDVGDSVYRVARDLFNRGEYGQAAAAFKQLAQRYPNSTYAAESQYFVAFALYRIGGTNDLREALTALEAQRSKYPNARSRAEAATLATRIRGVLAARGDAQAAAELARTANDQQPTCDKEEQAVQAEAMNALSRSDAANVNDLIQRVLARKDECAVPLRRTAVFLVGNRRDAQAITILSGVARSDPSVDVRVEAISVIGRLPSEEGVVVLEELAKNEDERIQRAAVRALVRHPSAKARQSIRSLVERDDVSDRVRSEALSAFDAERATADDITWLRSLYAKFQNPTLKARALSAIVRVGGPDVDQWLVSIARDENERSELRSTAMRRIGESMPVADLGRLYDGASQQRFRQEIIGILGKRKEDAATDKLIDIVKTGTDPSLRRAAISALADKNDPRATQLLLEIINK